MNAEATLSNGSAVKENGGGTVFLRGRQYNFEVVLEM
jgi:hypothetical protein